MATLADVQAAVAAEIRRVWPGNVPGTPLPGRGGAAGQTDDQYGWTLNAAGFAASAVAELKAQRTQIAGLVAAVDRLTTALADDNDLTADQLRQAVREAIAASPVNT